MHQNVRTGYDVSIPTAVRMSTVSKHGKSDIQYTARRAEGSSCADGPASRLIARKTLLLRIAGPIDAVVRIVTMRSQHAD